MDCFQGGVEWYSECFWILCSIRTDCHSLKTPAHMSSTCSNGGGQDTTFLISHNILPCVEYWSSIIVSVNVQRSICKHVLTWLIRNFPLSQGENFHLEFLDIYWCCLEASRPDVRLTYRGQQCRPGNRACTCIRRVGGSRMWLWMWSFHVRFSLTATVMTMLKVSLVLSIWEEQNVVTCSGFWRDVLPTYVKDIVCEHAHVRIIHTWYIIH